MPLSCGIPLGIIVAIMGLILYFATNYKKTAKLMVGIGVFITVLAIGAITLVMNSSM